MKKLLGFISTITASSMFMAATVFAADVKSELESITEKVQIFGGAIVVFSAVVTAILYMSSSINPKLKGTAKEALVALIIGVIILSLSNQISGYITSLTGHDLPQ